MTRIHQNTSRTTHFDHFAYTHVGAHASMHQPTVPESGHHRTRRLQYSAGTNPTVPGFGSDTQRGNRNDLTSELDKDTHPSPATPTYAKRKVAPPGPASTQRSLKKHPHKFQKQKRPEPKSSSTVHRFSYHEEQYLKIESSFAPPNLLAFFNTILPEEICDSFGVDRVRLNPSIHVNSKLPDTPAIRSDHMRRVCIRVAQPPIMIYIETSSPHIDKFFTNKYVKRRSTITYAEFVELRHIVAMEYDLFRDGRVLDRECGEEERYQRKRKFPHLMKCAKQALDSRLIERNQTLHVLQIIDLATKPVENNSNQQELQNFRIPTQFSTAFNGPTQFSGGPTFVKESLALRLPSTTNTNCQLCEKRCGAQEIPSLTRRDTDPLGVNLSSGKFGLQLQVPKPTDAQESGLAFKLQASTTDGECTGVRGSSSPPHDTTNSTKICTMPSIKQTTSSHHLTFYDDSEFEPLLVTTLDATVTAPATLSNRSKFQSEPACAPWSLNKMMASLNSSDAGSPAIERLRPQNTDVHNKWSVHSNKLLSAYLRSAAETRGAQAVEDETAHDKIFTPKQVRPSESGVRLRLKFAANTSVYESDLTEAKSTSSVDDTVHDAASTAYPYASNPVSTTKHRGNSTQAPSRISAAIDDEDIYASLDADLLSENRARRNQTFAMLEFMDRMSMMCKIDSTEITPVHVRKVASAYASLRSTPRAELFTENYTFDSTTAWYTDVLEGDNSVLSCTMQVDKNHTDVSFAAPLDGTLDVTPDGGQNKSCLADAGDLNNIAPALSEFSTTLALESSPTSTTCDFEVKPSTRYMFVGAAIPANGPVPRPRAAANNHSPLLSDLRISSCVHPGSFARTHFILVPSLSRQLISRLMVRMFHDRQEGLDRKTNSNGNSLVLPLWSHESRLSLIKWGSSAAPLVHLRGRDRTQNDGTHNSKLRTHPRNQRSQIRHPRSEPDVGRPYSIHPRDSKVQPSLGFLDKSVGVRAMLPHHERINNHLSASALIFWTFLMCAAHSKPARSCDETLALVEGVNSWPSPRLRPHHVSQVLFQCSLYGFATTVLLSVHWCILDALVYSFSDLSSSQGKPSVLGTRDLLHLSKRPPEVLDHNNPLCGTSPYPFLSKRKNTLLNTIPYVISPTIWNHYLLTIWNSHCYLEWYVHVQGRPKMICDIQLEHVDAANDCFQTYSAFQVSLTEVTSAGIFSIVRLFAQEDKERDQCLTTLFQMHNNEMTSTSNKCNMIFADPDAEDSSDNSDDESLISIAADLAAKGTRVLQKCMIQAHASSVSAVERIYLNLDYSGNEIDPNFSQSRIMRIFLDSVIAMRNAWIILGNLLQKIFSIL